MHTKVFVGNLSFKTKAEELAAEFSVAGRVVSANIITRGPRSLGYGFVEMESEEEAQKAVALLNKKSVDAREINVELAKPREDKPPGERGLPGDRRPRGRRGGRGGRGGGRGPRGPSDSPQQGGSPQNNNGGQGGQQGGQGGAQNNSNQGGQGGQNNSNNAGGGQRRSFRRGGRFSRGGGEAGNGGQGGEPRPRGEPRQGGQGGQGGPNAGGPPRERRPRGGRFGGGERGQGGQGGRRDFNQQNRTPSPTTLFVANLPFALDDEGLFKLFKDLKVNKAHVVKNRNQRSKGFGFVEFDNEGDQKSALTASEKMVVDGRELIVKVALTAPEPRDGGSNNAGGAAPAAPASSSSSSAAAPAAASAPAAAASPAPVAAAAKDTPAAKPEEKSS